jgi:hypothetical protein
VEEWFQTKQAGRDTGYFLPDWEGELNWTFDRSEQGYPWHQTFHDGPPDRYHQRQKINDASDPYQPHDQWYDNLPQSWNRGTDIYDILSPGGTNNTTQYDYAYPGQNMAGSGPIQQSNRGYPNYDSWVAAGSNLGDLPWLAAPYSPGYHKNDPDRPEKKS